ncbi:MAG: InlB B-repeat-containing protein [Candidatus Izemoplasmatales bacterium]
MKRLIFSFVILLVIFGVQGCSEQALSTTVDTTNSEQVGTEENTEETTLSLFNLMVSFNSNGGSPVDSVLITDVNYQGEFPVPERSGYSFLGWYIDINQFPFDYDFSLLTDTSVTLQAKWEKNQYLLTIMDGELNLHQESVYYDTSINEILNSFQDKEGHSFEGWYLDFGNEQIAEFTYMPANDVILYGKWDRNAY